MLKFYWSLQIVEHWPIDFGLGRFTKSTIEINVLLFSSILQSINDSKALRNSKRVYKAADNVTILVEGSSDYKGPTFCPASGKGEKAGSFCSKLATRVLLISFSTFLVVLLLVLLTHIFLKALSS